jgi:hypothetical protein
MTKKSQVKFEKSPLSRCCKIACHAFRNAQARRDCAADQGKSAVVTDVAAFWRNPMYTCAQARMCGVSRKARYIRYISLFSPLYFVEKSGKEGSGGRNGS